MSRTKKAMTVSLPPARCSPDMRDRLVAIAEKQGRSLSDIQREAIRVFLSQFDTKSIMTDTPSTILQ